MKSIRDLISKNAMFGWLLFLGTIAVIFVLGLLTFNILERRLESKMAYKPMNPIHDHETRNERWGLNFPRQFHRYFSTMESDTETYAGGSKKFDELARDPRLVILWAGYGFSKEYNQGRGHYNAVEDVRNILRTNPNQAGTCWTCKSPDVPRVMEEMGVAEFYASKWGELGPEIVNPIGCYDCHDPQTMNLRITRPALIEAYERQGKDIRDASHQEMRSLVCAQCHVEYYFKGKGKYLTFPWDNGTSVEDMEKYYDEREFSDWTHKLSKAPMIKAQHPGYELWLTGTHAKRGVSCADCHMPYRTEGGVKFTDHKIQSPLMNISNACMVCHRESEETLKESVQTKQKKIKTLRIQAEENLVQAHFEAKTAWDLGAKEDEMKPILTLIRHAQWRWDFSVASHGGSFHSSLETARILATSIQKSQEARRLLVSILAKYGHTGPVEVPDISTKEKAQAVIGLDMDKLNAEKQEFLKTVVPQWDKAAAERHAEWDEKYQEQKRG